VKRKYMRGLMKKKIFLKIEKIEYKLNL